MTAERRNRQDAPYPVILEDLVSKLVLEPGWTVGLSERTRDTGSPEQGRGLTLSITTLSFDTYHPERGRIYRVIHDFPVPPATYNAQSWTRWLFERYLDVLRHEGMEFFALAQPCICEADKLNLRHGDDKFTHRSDCAAQQPYRPYAPNHGPGNDPYVVREETTDLDRRTQFTGNVDHR